MVEDQRGVQVISGGSGLADLANLSDTQRDTLISSLAELEAMADVLIVDTGADIGPNVLQFILAAQELIVVTTPEPTAITDAYSLIKVVSRLSSEVSLKAAGEPGTDCSGGRRDYEQHRRRSAPLPSFGGWQLWLFTV